MVDVASIIVVPPGQERWDEPERRPELIVAGCFEGEAPDVDGAGEAVREAAAAPGRPRRLDRAGRPGRPAEIGPAGVLTVYGLGKRGDLTFPRLRRWFARAAEAAGGAGRATFVLPRHAETAGEAAGRVLRGLALSSYRYDRFLSEDGRKAAAGIGRSGRRAAAGRGGGLPRRRGAAAATVAAAVAFARDLANAPPNEASPAWMEERARELAASRGMEVTVLDAAELARRGMGGLLAVGAGAAVPPRLVRLAWGTEGPVIALVGKGITFDTGGISIKPAADMDEMKYDKAGACAVLGAARAVADLGLPVRLARLHPVRREHARAARPTGPATSCACTTARRWRSPTPTPRGG